MSASNAKRQTPGEQAIRDTLRSELSFFASFDHGPDADYARGDRLIYSAPTYKDIDFAVADLPGGDIDIAKGQGRFGDALETGCAIATNGRLHAHVVAALSAR